MEWIAIGAALLAISGLFVWILLRQRSELKASEGEIKAKEQEIRTLSAQNASAQTALELKEKEYSQLQGQLTLQFENLAHKILETNSQKFAQSNQQNMESLLKPLGEQLTSYKKMVEETHLEQTKQRSSLDERIRLLIEQTGKVSAQANSLAEALKGQAKTQGNWGEMVLERILEYSGLIKDTHYFVQETIEGENGRQLRPDVLIRLPEDKIIIIDSKVSLTAYDRFMAAQDSQQSDAAQRDQALQDHLTSIRRHVDELSVKKYDRLEGSLDFTMMFIPIEPAYICAVQKDPGLWEYAYEKRILLISPTNLIACLKLMSDIWTHEMQSKNALDIAHRGELMYDKFVSFVQTLENLGKTLGKSQDAYNTAMNQLKDGNGNLMGQAQKLKELGVKATKKLSE